MFAYTILNGLCQRYYVHDRQVKRNKSENVHRCVQQLTRSLYIFNDFFRLLLSIGDFCFTLRRLQPIIFIVQIVHCHIGHKTNWHCVDYICVSFSFMMMFSRKSSKCPQSLSLKYTSILNGIRVMESTFFDEEKTTVSLELKEKVENIRRKKHVSTVHQLEVDSIPLHNITSVIIAILS